MRGWPGCNALRKRKPSTDSTPPHAPGRSGTEVGVVRITHGAFEREDVRERLSFEDRHAELTEYLAHVIAALVIPREAEPYSRVRSVAPGMYSYSSSRYSTPIAVATVPAGREKRFARQGAATIVRSKISCEVREGVMKAAASGVIAPIPNGFTGTQPSTWVMHTT